MSKSGKTVILEWSPVLPRGTDKSFNCITFRTLAEDLKPSLIVLPSKDYDFKTTESFLIKFGLSLCWSNFDQKKYLGLLQGTTIAEIQECYSFYKGMGIETLGLASPLELTCPRKTLVSILEPSEDIYFIEAYSDPLQELEDTDIKGFCSSYPVRLGLVGRTLMDWGPTPPKLDFYSTEDTDLVSENLRDLELSL
jgi:hypothetical protein